MKSWIILIVLAVGLTTAFTFAIPMLSTSSSPVGPGFPAPTSGASEGPSGTVEVEGDLAYKFGVMAQDSDGQHTWVFKNVGPGSLELRNLGTDCSCTVAKLGKPGVEGEAKPTFLTIKPGETETIDVKWNTRQGNGPYRKTARIGTNDPKRPEIALSVEGTVRPAVTLLPGEAAINFQTVSNDEPSKRTVAFYSSDRPEMKVTGVVSSKPELIAAEVRPMTEEEAKSVKATRGYVLDVTLKTSPSLGSFAEEVVVGIDHPMKKEIRLPVMGRLTGPITLTPDRVVLRDVTSSNGGGTDLILWVRGRTSAEFSVVSKPESVDVAFEAIPQPPGSKGSKYKMSIKVIPGTPTGKILGDIVLKTDHPQATELKVPIDILVQGAN